MNSLSNTTKVEDRWKPPITRLTFSDWNTRRQIYLPNPWLAFTLTIEFRKPSAPASDYFFQLTLPGCIFTPFKPGLDGEYGQFQPPIPWGRGQARVSGPTLQPEWITKRIEAELRNRSEVILWTKRAIGEYKGLRVDPYDPKALKKLKSLLRRTRAEK